MTTLEGKDNKLENKRVKSSRELEAEIGETRNAITEDIKAIGDKVSPAALKQEAKQAWTGVKEDTAQRVTEAKDAVIEKAVEVKDAAVEKAVEVRDVAVEKAQQVRDVAVEKASEAADAIAETAAEAGDITRRASQAAWIFAVDNAVPLGLISMGAGWLILNNRRQRSFRAQGYDASWPRDVDYPGVSVEGSPESTELYSTPSYEAYRPGYRTGQPRPVRRDLRPSQSNGQQSDGNGAASAAIRAKDKLQQTVSQAEGKLRASAVRSKDLLQTRARQVAETSRNFAQANPMALALGTLIAGIGVGLLLPSSAREDRLLEPGRRRVRNFIGEARDTTREVSGIVRETAQETAHALR